MISANINADGQKASTAWDGSSAARLSLDSSSTTRLYANGPKPEPWSNSDFRAFFEIEDERGDKGHLVQPKLTLLTWMWKLNILQISLIWDPATDILCVGQLLEILWFTDHCHRVRCKLTAFNPCGGNICFYSTLPPSPCSFTVGRGNKYWIFLAEGSHTGGGAFHHLGFGFYPNQLWDTLRW